MRRNKEKKKNEDDDRLSGSIGMSQDDVKLSLLTDQVRIDLRIEMLSQKLDSFHILINTHHKWH